MVLGARSSPEECLQRGPVCGQSPSKAVLWPFLFEMGMAALPSGKEYVSANFYKVQNLVGSFL